MPLPTYHAALKNILCDLFWSLNCSTTTLFHCSNEFWMRNLILNLGWLVSNRHTEFTYTSTALHLQGPANMLTS